MEETLMKSPPRDTKKVFRELGTCSRTFCNILNYEFDCPKEVEERAADPMAGGIMQKGHQCGMLWGAALAVGTEAFRRCEDCSQATGLAIKATQHLLESFSKRTGTVNCREITHTDFSKKWQMTWYMLFRARRCFNLAEDWAPEAIEAAREGLAEGRVDLPLQSMSCASEVARKMGANDEEMIMVAGFAGGLGLSGHACGALAAAIWMNSLAWCRENPEESSFFNPRAQSTLDAFYETTDGEILCEKLAGRRFATTEDHSEYIRNGGCAKLMDALAKM